MVNFRDIIINYYLKTIINCQSCIQQNKDNML